MKKERTSVWKPLTKPRLAGTRRRARPIQTEACRAPGPALAALPAPASALKRRAPQPRRAMERR